MNTKPKTRLLLLTLSTMTTLMLTLWPTSLHAQKSCDETPDPQACLVVKTAEAMCRGAFAAQDQLGDSKTPGTCLGDLKLAEDGKADKAGELRACEAARAVLTAQARDTRGPLLPRWVFATWDLVAVASGTATGICLGANCPPELSVGLAVGASIFAIGRIIFEFIRAPR